MHTFTHALAPSTLLELSYSWRLVVAVVLGVVMGVERSIAGKHAGLRTYGLVSLGSCAFTLVGVIAAQQLSMFSGINPFQIAGYVVLGIGFIGSGLAMTGNGQPSELTTATGIWVAASVGMLCGFGLYVLAFAVTAISLIVLVLLASLERILRAHNGK